MNPWDEIAKLPLDKNRVEAVAKLMSRPIIAFFTPIEELKPMIDFLERDGRTKWIN
jgi:hypothetical protein